MDGQITLTVAAGTVLILTGPGGAPPPAMPVLVRDGTDIALVDDATVLGAGAVTWDVAPGVYEVRVLAPPGDPKRPARPLEVLTFQVEHPHAARIAELEAEIAWLDELIGRMSTYRAERAGELEGLRGTHRRDAEGAEERKNGGG